MKTLKSRFLALAAVVTLVAAGAAYAQVTYNRGSGSNDQAAGIIVPVTLGSDSIIVDGTWLMVDTTTAATTNQKRIVVKPWNGVVVNRYKMVGIAVGSIKKLSNAPTGHRGAVGNCLIWGYHPNAKGGASAPTACDLPIKMGPALYGKANINGDTLSATVGWVIGPGTNNAATNPRWRVFLQRPGTPSPLLAN